MMVTWIKQLSDEMVDKILLVYLMDRRKADSLYKLG